MPSMGRVLILLHKLGTIPSCSQVVTLTALDMPSQLSSGPPPQSSLIPPTYTHTNTNTHSQIPSHSRILIPTDTHHTQTLTLTFSLAVPGQIPSLPPTLGRQSPFPSWLSPPEHHTPNSSATHLDSKMIENRKHCDFHTNSS